ncbi:MAG: MFS transporter [Candidatus Baltobacteraceae bacterium]
MTPSKITGTRSNTPNAALLAAFWFGIQALWGALLGISLQARATSLHPVQHAIAYGELAAIGAVTASIVQLIAGPLSDRLRARGFDRRWFFLVGALLGSLGIFGFYLAQSFLLLAVALVFLQIGINIAIGPYQAIIPDYFSRAKAGLASSWMAGLQSLGNAAGAVCAVVLSSQPLVLSSALVFVLLVSCVITVAHVAGLRVRPIDRVPFKVGRAAIDLFISRAILWTGFYTMLGYMFFYVHDTLQAKDAVTTSGMVILIFTVFGAAGAAFTAKPADRLDRRMVVNASTGVFICSLIGFVFVRDVRIMFVLAAFAGVGWGGFLAADWALGCSILPQGMMATAMGVWNLAVAVPQIIAPALTTAIVLGLHPQGHRVPLYAFGLAVLETALGTAWIWRLPAAAGKET